MIDEHQSQFSAEQAALQLPPELNPALKPPPSTIPRKTPGYKIALIVAGSGLGAMLLLSVIYRVFFFHPAIEQSTPPPSPTPPVQQLNSTQQALSDLRRQVEDANPQDYAFPPPPVDMQVTF